MNDTFEWRTLSLDLQIVKEFIEKETNSSDGLMMPENLPPVAGGEIIDDEEAEDMDQTD